MALLALTLIVTSPFLYCFSRLAILEPMLIALDSGSSESRRPPAADCAGRWPRRSAIGLLFTLMVLTKTTAVFLLPALGWAMVVPLWRNASWRCAAPWPRLGASAAAFGLWMALIIHFGLFADYKYFFFVNNYTSRTEFYWPLVSFWWSFHGGLWVDHILIPLAGLVVLGAIRPLLAWRGAQWGRKLLRDPVFGASMLAVAGIHLLHGLPEPSPAPLLCRGGLFLFFHCGAGN